jgi:hypothetical protein
LNHLYPLFPALKRWAKLGRPSGAGFSDILFCWLSELFCWLTENEFSHTLALD